MMKALKSMTYAELVALRAKIDTAIQMRDAKERHDLAKMIETMRKGSAQNTGKPVARAHALKGRSLKPKYRNPADRTQTWAGRGLQPRWLSAELKRGKKLVRFLIK